MLEHEQQHVQNRITAGLVWLAQNFGTADADEFSKAHHPGGRMLLEGLVSRGYVVHRPKLDDYTLTRAGFTREKFVAAPIGMETAVDDAPDPNADR